VHEATLPAGADILSRDSVPTELVAHVFTHLAKADQSERHGFSLSPGDQLLRRTGMSR
jgi:hypothetical protein